MLTVEQDNSIYVALFGNDQFPLSNYVVTHCLPRKRHKTLTDQQFVHSCFQSTTQLDHSEFPHKDVPIKRERERAYVFGNRQSASFVAIAVFFYFFCQYTYPSNQTYIPFIQPRCPLSPSGKKDVSIKKGLFGNRHNFIYIFKAFG